MKRYVVYAVRATYDLSMEYRYVGITGDKAARIKQHRYESSTPSDSRYHLPKSRWMRKKYFSVTFDILEECLTPEALKIAEMKWVHVLRVRGHRLLNLTDGGEGTYGWDPSIEWRNHRSKMMTGSGNTMYGMRGPLSPRYGKTMSQEFRDNLSTKRIGESNPFYGKKHSEETLTVISSKLSGDKNPASVLSNDDVFEIRRRRDSGERAVDLAKEYGVHRGTIDRAYKRAMRMG